MLNSRASVSREMAELPAFHATEACQVELAKLLQQDSSPWLRDVLGLLLDQPGIHPSSPDVLDVVHAPLS